MISVNLSPLIIALAGFLGGLFVGWLGHRWADKRDRRKEFNEASEATFVALTRQLRSIQSSHFYTEGIDSTLFRHHIAWWRRPGFDEAVREYKESQQRATSQDESGAIIMDMSVAAPVERSVLILLRYLRRR